MKFADKKLCLIAIAYLQYDAALYEVETFNLNKTVKRNIGRFPGDFMFQLTKDEW